MTVPLTIFNDWQMTASQWQITVFYALLGYIAGSFLSAYYLPLWLHHIDVTEDTPDHNPGTANAFMKAGIPCGVLVLLCELGKGLVPVMLARGRLPLHCPGFALIMLAPVIGHGWSCFYRGGGGKAIAVTFGVLLGILPEARPLLLLCFFYLFFSLIIRIRSHRIRTAVTFTLWSLSVILLVHIPPVAAAGVGIAAVVLYKHRRPDGEGSPVRKRLRLRKKAS